jgi:hypothetical protein
MAQGHQQSTNIEYNGAEQEDYIDDLMQTENQQRQVRLEYDTNNLHGTTGYIK